MSTGYFEIDLYTLPTSYKANLNWQDPIRLKKHSRNESRVEKALAKISIALNRNEEDQIVRRVIFCSFSDDFSLVVNAGG